MSKENKKNNKVVIISASICGAVIAIIVLLLTVTEPIIGIIKLSNVREAAESCDEIVISAPLYKDAFLQGAEAVVIGEDAKALSDAFIKATENTDFDDVYVSASGFWDTKLEFYGDGERYSGYLCDDEIYVARGVKVYRFEIEDECEALYEAFLSRVNSILDEQKK